MALNEMLTVLNGILPDLMDELPPARARRLLDALDALRRDGPGRRGVDVVVLLAEYLPPEHPVRRAFALRGGRGAGSAVLDETAELLRALGVAVDEAMSAIADEPPEADWRAVLDRAKVALLSTPGIDADAVRATGNNPDEQGLIALPHPDGRLRYPSFQFGADGAPLPVVRTVNTILAADRDPWGVAGWWFTANGWLGESPAAASSAGRDTAVVQAARIALERD